MLRYGVAPTPKGPAPLYKTRLFLTTYVSIFVFIIDFMSFLLCIYNVVSFQNYIYSKVFAFFPDYIRTYLDNKYVK